MLTLNFIRRSLNLTVIVILVSISSTQAQDNGQTYAIIISGDSAFLQPETEAYAMTKGHITHKTDLNHDNQTDLIIHFNNCGNWGDCIFGFFVADATGSYTCVYEEYLPIFTLAKTTTTVNETRWTDIVVHERATDADGNPTAKGRKMHFDGVVYRVE